VLRGRLPGCGGCFISVHGRQNGGLPQKGEVEEKLSNGWPSGLPMLFGLWLEKAGFCNLPGVFNF
jgi:hypothetical protein